MGAITYRYGEIKEESRLKMEAVMIHALHESLKRLSGSCGLKPVRVTVNSDCLVVEIHYYHPGMGVGAIAGFLTLTYDHKLACYQFVSYEEQRA